MEDLNAQITKELETHLPSTLAENILSGDQNYQDIYDYIMFPTGKLFRANLVWRFYCDLNNLSLDSIRLQDYPNVSLVSSAVEIHHAYTLAHDDLPCMDDDDFRRGKESAHKKFNEWKALLAGDGLLNMSYELLSRSTHESGISIINDMGRLCGASGLIYGQYLDLEQDTTDFDLQRVIKIHHLKTANLFIFALNAATRLSGKENSNLELSERIGLEIGVLFQLIDDLTELTEKPSKHEQAINPWLNEFKKTLKIFENYIIDATDALKNFRNLNELIENYLHKIQQNVSVNQKTIEENLGNKIDSVLTLLKK